MTFTFVSSWPFFYGPQNTVHLFLAFSTGGILKWFNCNCTFFLFVLLWIFHFNKCIVMYPIFQSRNLEFVLEKWVYQGKAFVLVHKRPISLVIVLEVNSSLWLPIWASYWSGSWETVVMTHVIGFLPHILETWVEF